MTSAEIITALERERQLLVEFHSLSGQQLELLEDENLDGMDSLLTRRSELMIELTAIETTLGTWISQIRHDPSVTPEMMHELRMLNDEIVQLAKEVVEIDAHTHWRLDLIRERTRSELKSIDTGAQALYQYEAVLPSEAPRLDYEG